MVLTLFLELAFVQFGLDVPVLGAPSPSNRGRAENAGPRLTSSQAQCIGQGRAALAV